MLEEQARAKINLSLRILGRRADGYHWLESLAAFADFADTLTLDPGQLPGLSIEGVSPESLGPLENNLVLKAARNFAARAPGLKSGRFHLLKRLPAAAGIGGGSADAAAALRLLARLNGIALDDPLLLGAAKETGADVPVCLFSRARIMSGIGDRLGLPLDLPPLNALLVNPGVAVATKDVFAALGLQADGVVPASREPLPALENPGSLMRYLASQRNDLEPAAIRIAPEISDVLSALRGLEGCRLARMSGSGATCFGLFESRAAAEASGSALKQAEPRWRIFSAALS